MTPEQIGTRPRIIQHLMRLTPTPFIADGMLASPGLNPALFEQAGLLEDDVVKQVNGLRVTIPSELDEIQRRLPQLSTLELLIERRGRTLTIILDIPSESLSISH